MTHFEEQLRKAVQLQIQYTPTVQKHMQPALAALGLDYFWFVRLLPGENHISIGIQQPLAELYRERQTEDLFFKNPSILVQKQTAVIWDLKKTSQLTNDMTTRIGLQNGMCIFRRRHEYVDVFYVASTNAKSNLYELYLNHAQAIYRLVDFFQAQVLPLLPMDNPDFLLPYMDGYKLELPKADQSKDELGDFYDATVLKNFTLHDEDGRTYKMTLRELQCVYHLALGRTSKEIAQELGLSHRTVEHYIESIRYKTGKYDKSKLVSLYRENDVALWFNG